MKLFSVGAIWCAMAISAIAADKDAWRSEVTPPPPGSFPKLPSIRMNFSFGWSDILEAAQAQATFAEKDGIWQADVSGGSLGLAGLLWSLKATHHAEVDARTLLPIAMKQSEQYRSRRIETELQFDPEGVKRLRKVSTSKSKSKWKRVEYPSIRDVIGSVLFVRSLPLKNGDRIGLVCFPGDSPYLAIARVEGREKISCMGKDWPAIRLSLEIRKLEVENGKPVGAVSYSKFKSGTFWVSDDELRLPLRAEVRIFIGFVYGELTGYKLLGSSTKQ